MKKTRDNALDIIKCLAILGVLLIHILGNKRDFCGVFWYAQAVPVFMVIMGYNASEQLPTTQKLLRLYIPYLLVFFTSYLLGKLLGVVPSSKLDYLPVGFLPTAGPGTYWITLFFMFLFITPLYKQMMLRYPSIFVLAAIWCVSYLFEYQWDAGGVNGGRWLYASNPIRYSMCVALGIFLCQKGSCFYIKYLFMFYVPSAIYLYAINYTSLSLSNLRFTNMGWSAGENCIAAFYPALIVAILHLLLRKLHNNFFVKITTTIGRNTYSIFLFQIIWFCIPNIPYRNLLTIPICVLGGFILNRIAKSTLKRMTSIQQ